jgi:hypothetical protein
MRRRELITLVGGATVALPAVALAQQPPIPGGRVSKWSTSRSECRARWPQCRDRVQAEITARETGSNLALGGHLTLSNTRPSANNVTHSRAVEGALA